ncbi:MAG: SIR2 family protein [Sandaracinus sp.]|nr:SIR2 family protein [Sandaracinus sp.]
MTILSLRTAAVRIRETRRAAAKRGRHAGPSPYFFVCGAGISVPSVPLAWQIQEECRDRATSLGLATGSAPSDPAGAYSYWLEQAFPDPEQRRAYFRKAIDGKPLTDANLRLAHLLADGALTSFLVTPNFDDFVARALHLFGEPCVVCDHPATTARIDLDAPEPQVVHVHGSYWFYDLVNTDAEIRARAAGHRDGPGMGELLGDLLRARVPLVVGYSGWESDVIMTALKARLLLGPLRHQIYWFCYSQRALEALPTWVREHPNVCFVLPEAPETALPADRVFDELLRVFEVEAPPITRDPLHFYADQLRRLVPERAADAPPDPYFFEDVIRRLQRAARLLGDDARKVEPALEQVRDAVRRGRYALAAKRANAVPLKSLRKEQLGGLLDALWAAVTRGGRTPKEELEIHAAFLRIVDERPRTPVEKGRLAGVLIARVAALLASRDPAAALEAALDAPRRLGEELTKMPRAQHRLGRLRARALVELDRKDEALEVYEALESRFGRAVEVRLRASTSGAARERAELLVKLGREADAEALLDRVAGRLEGSVEPRLQRELAAVLEARAPLREARGRTAEAQHDRERAAKLREAAPPNGTLRPPALDA